MNIKKLIDCLTNEERQKLLSLLEERKAHDVNVPFTKFIEETDCSVRLYNVLREGMRWRGWDKLMISELDFNEFSKQRNAGVQSWLEFIKLRDGYIGI
jgi:hypothetical protein